MVIGRHVLLHEWSYDVADRPVLQVGESGALCYNSVEPTDNITTWVYEQGSFTPVAKLAGGERYSIVSDYIGRPVQVFNDVGEIVWETEYDIYGRLRSLRGERSLIPFRQVGQYEDEELDGLYLNRFRFYDSNTGLYISQDPIGLDGSNANFYGYVFDSNSQTDPLGLLTYNTMPGKANYQKHHIIPQQLKNHSVLKNAGINIHDSSNVKYLPTSSGIDPNPDLAIHKGSHPKYTQAVQRDLNKIAKKSNGKGWTQAQYKSEVDKIIKKYDNLLEKGKIKCK